MGTKVPALVVCSALTDGTPQSVRSPYERIGSPMTRGWFAKRWAGSALAEESDAFLAGRYVERLLERGEVTHVSPWMWLNCLAHADLRRVSELGSQGPYVRERADSWPDARMLIARQVLDLCHDNPVELRRLQAAVLVPLELRMMSLPRLTPARWTEIAITELKLTGAL